MYYNVQYGLLTIIDQFMTILHYSCIFLACQAFVSCNSNTKVRKTAGSTSTTGKVSRSPKLPPMEDMMQEDTFDSHVPKFEEAQRAKEIKNMDVKASNKGEYKTWNKLMVGVDDFEKPIPKTPS
ncbi:hypothetical protein DICVIV_05734 [Dictyocaulus viviparus]|uniref:Uncharacterized protein n=1 Tax=Dictyocaulus viviparus TaxID=29172 RepID=A0A0D8XUG2_DICVI|nr:hypothetical protein DICVIV_05734 [Dictyocaulus viviparus]